MNENRKKAVESCFKQLDATSVCDHLDPFEIEQFLTSLYSLGADNQKVVICALKDLVFKSGKDQ